MSSSPLRIRTITYFAGLGGGTLAEAATFFEMASTLLKEAGFEVQSTRVATELVQCDLATWKELDRELADRGLILCTGPFADPADLDQIIQILKETQNVFLSFAMKSDMPDDSLHQLAALILRIGSELGESCHIM